MIIVMESCEMLYREDIRAFLKRRGLTVAVGLVMYLSIVLIHFLKA